MQNPPHTVNSRVLMQELRERERAKNSLDRHLERRRKGSGSLHEVSELQSHNDGGSVRREWEVKTSSGLAAASLTHQISVHLTLTVLPHPGMEHSPYAAEGPGVPTEPMPSATDVSIVQGYSPDDLPELECAVCFSQFNNVFNTPKVLQCGHTFCLECLARINIKSSQPESLQCPLCRAYTPLPNFGLPKLDTDVVVLSCLPEAMQHVYSIRFNRNRGKLQVKRIPSSIPASQSNQRRSLDLGGPVSTDNEQDSRRGICPFFSRLLRISACRAVFMMAGMLIMVSLAIGISIIFSKRQ